MVCLKAGANEVLCLGEGLIFWVVNNMSRIYSIKCII